MRELLLLGGLATLLLSSPVTAQPKLRPLEVPPTAGWQHARTSLILPSRIAGLARTSLHDNGADELDVVAQYGNEDDRLFATVYLFHSQIPSVPVWFDRARTVIEERPVYDVGAEEAGPVHGLTLENAEVARGLSVAYPLDTGGLTSTALAVAPAKGWMVKVRMSSRDLPAAALEQKLVKFVQDIRWPEVSATMAAPAAAPVQPCPARLSYRRAKQLKPDLAQTLFGSIMAASAAIKPSAEVRYCRETSAGVPYGVYRPVGDMERYVIALADSGRAVSVGKSSNITDLEKSIYSVSKLDLGRSGIYPSFDRLPKPDQVMQLVSKSAPAAAAEAGTNTVTIDASTLD